MEMEMKSIASLVFLVQALIMNGVNYLAIAQVPTPTQQEFQCRPFRFKSLIFNTNRDKAFETLREAIGSRSEYTGYYATQSGNKGEQVYAMALCPPDVKVEACRECIKHTGLYLRQKCYVEKEGVAYTSLATISCIVCYSDEEIERKPALTWGLISFANPNTEVKQHADAGLDLLESKLKDKTAGGDNRRKFASESGVYGGPGWPTIYGSMQCTPDITKDDCFKCLSDAVASLHLCCASKGKISGRSFLPSCYVRYAHEKY